MKRNHSLKELDQLQKVKKENQSLKKELSYLRKQISRLDLEGLESAKQMCFDHEEKQKLNEELGEPNSNLEVLKKEWGCKEEGCAGFLEVTLYSKLGITHYYRKCNSCSNRTKGKRYDSSSVKGILKNG